MHPLDYALILKMTYDEDTFNKIQYIQSCNNSEKKFMKYEQTFEEKIKNRPNSIAELK